MLKCNLWHFEQVFDDKIIHFQAFVLVELHCDGNTCLTGYKYAETMIVVILLFYNEINNNDSG